MASAQAGKETIEMILVCGKFKLLRLGSVSGERFTSKGFFNMGYKMASQFKISC